MQTTLSAETRTALENFRWETFVELSEQRHDGERLQMYSLQDGEYRQIDASQSMPGLTVAMIDSVLEKRFLFGETALIRAFRQSLGH